MLKISCKDSDATRLLQQFGVNFTDAIATLAHFAGMANASVCFNSLITICVQTRWGFVARCCCYCTELPAYGVLTRDEQEKHLTRNQTKY